MNNRRPWPINRVKSADAVERDYRELKSLIDAAKIDKEMKLLKEFSDNWNALRVIDRELLSLAVENTNLKAANLSSTEAAQATGKLRAAPGRGDGYPRLRR